jgi:hypothetical protein
MYMHTCMLTCMYISICRHMHLEMHSPTYGMCMYVCMIWRVQQGAAVVPAAAYDLQSTAYVCMCVWCVHVCVYVRVCIMHECATVCVWLRARACVYPCVYIHIILICIYIFIYIYIYMYIYTYKCTFAFTYRLIYTHVHTCM